jgi:hypothetical protein
MENLLDLDVVVDVENLDPTTSLPKSGEINSSNLGSSFGKFEIRFVFGSTGNTGLINKSGCSNWSKISSNLGDEGMDLLS